MDTMTYVLFGATGDLAKRKIFPAFYNLFLEQKLPDSISIIGAGRDNMSDSAFQHYVEEAITTFSRRSILDCGSLKKFIESIRYCSKLCKSFEEKEIYRIDHYLGKPMVWAACRGLSKLINIKQSKGSS